MTLKIILDGSDVSKTGEFPCVSCHTNCCKEYVIFVNAHDIYRLSVGLGLAPESFLAIYGVSKLVGVETSAGTSEAGKEFGILLTPIEAGVDSGKQSVIKFPQDSRISNECSNRTIFGEQKIGVSVYSDLNKGWSDEGEKSTFYNKYLFSSGY